MTRLIRVLAVLLALALTSGDVALAHERRQVGPYTFIVGFLGEPAFTGVPNAVDLRVTETGTNKPVEGLQDSLEVEIAAAGQVKRLKLRARFGQPGGYAADFVPTRSTSYVFRFVGKVGDRQIDERFESGPNRFHEPEDIATARFPAEDSARDLRDAVDQTRLLAIAAVVLAVAIPVGLRLWRRP